ncbi:hypothetical protein GCG54_00007404 [Colletotrichum gloeosporioides]|uniref:Uncharacterized protein n=1 Tax=Colletotrichum gloeosporioides TaxID=474922 RepID=A0A8H4CPD9_COLGL|nr:uncharacterized protein GCG54_00007404 [Colletotrichum gloeosporioides]KAF3807671.1 hypothetical protein GCG54_00007404 [Colletotrichum gloeosporioides]
MNPSSPAKRRALAPLDANVNAMSPKRQLHNKTTMPGSPLKSPIKSPLGLKRSLDTVIFDENSVVPKKKQCQEPVKLAAPSPAPAPALSLKAERVSAAAASPAPAAPTSTSTPPPAPAQTEEDMPDAKEVRDLHTSPEGSEANAYEGPQQTTQEEPLRLKPEKKDAITTAADDEQTQRQQTPRRSASPATSSVFDSSAMDTSQNTTILTEPDQEQAARTTTTLPPPRPRRLLTREEARQVRRDCMGDKERNADWRLLQKARILRLKLGLANYKLQTGQEDVPLDRLQVKPLPGQEKRALPRVTVQPPSSRDGPPESEATIEADDRREEETQEEEVVVTKPEKATLPAVPEEASTAEDSASPVCGGAVSSLLSLARASSSVSASS